MIGRKVNAMSPVESLSMNGGTVVEGVELGTTIILSVHWRGSDWMDYGFEDMESAEWFIADCIDAIENWYAQTLDLVSPAQFKELRDGALEKMKQWR